MAYNYGPPPGAFGARQPPYNAGNYGAPPGIAAQPSPAGIPGQFQPPNMPNINFNAPVIRLGVDQHPPDNQAGGGGERRGGGARGSNAEPLGNRSRLGLGAEHHRGGGGDRNLDRERAAVRESMMALQPPTREEVARTIFVGGLGDGTPDDAAIESILRCAGKLRRWTRVRDADDKKCKFGFAEYEDVDSLEAANEIFTDVEVPLLKNGAVVNDEAGEVKKVKLLVVVDDQSKRYIDEWKGRRREDDDARQFRLDGCKEDLRQSLTSIANVAAFAANAAANPPDVNGDTHMADANTNGDATSAEVVTIPLTLEDELSDVPAEMRATVAAEIKAFRDRSNRRDLERLRQEEDLEIAERQRSLAASRPSRLGSPPTMSAPSGPASASNGIPMGPRGQVQGAPAGPKGYRGAQLPNDYVNGVSFVGANGGAPNGIRNEDEDSDASDSELERRRQAAHTASAEKAYADAARRWQNRERTRSAAIARERQREESELAGREREKAMILKRLREWNDDEEARLGREEYYHDRSSWLRKRGAYRDREQRDDDRDRANEEREKGDEGRKTAVARDMADDFLSRTGDELEQKAGQTEQPAFGGFKISLGSAAARTKAAAAASAPAPRRAIADVEGLLEDEEDAAASGLKRPELKPLTDTSTAPIASEDLTDSDRQAARQALAADIPTTSQELFAYPMQWRYLSPSILNAHIRPFVEKKVVEYLGVQEDLLVNFVMDGLQDRKGAAEIKAELEEALEEEAEVLVRKVWRMCVFWTESEARGLN